jgi:hypothetical protein
MDELDIAEIRKDVVLDQKIEEILRQCEENIISMHFSKIGPLRDKQDELRDDRILGNFQRIIHILSTTISNEMFSIEHRNYEPHAKEKIVEELAKMKVMILEYERHIADLKRLVKPPESLVEHSRIATQIRDIMIKDYDELHDLYKDITALDASVVIKLRVLGQMK